MLLESTSQKAMERGRSVPASLAPNPFWSARTRDEMALQRMRPEGLPVVPATPEEDLHSLDGLAPLTQQGTEMRSTRSRSSERGSRKRTAPVPRSWNPVRDIYKMTFERDAEHFREKAKDVNRKSLGPQEVGRKTSGLMPAEAEDAVQRGDGRQSSLEDELGKQLVHDLLAQNQALQAEIQRLTARAESGTATESAEASTWSKVSEAEPQTPRQGTSQAAARFTPQGTRVPDGSPGVQEQPPPPPMWGLEYYEVQEMDKKTRARDWVWIPEQEKQESRREGSPTLQWWKDEVYRLQQVMHEKERSRPVVWGPPVTSYERLEGERYGIPDGDRALHGGCGLSGDRALHGGCGLDGDRARHGDSGHGSDQQRKQRDDGQEGDLFGQGEVPGMKGGRSRNETEGDSLKSTTIVLPQLTTVGNDAGLQCGDWMAQIRPLMGDLATNALAWWDAMVQEVNTKYQVWLAASPLERLNMAYPDEKVYNTSLARQRMDLRSSALLMAAVPTSLKEELVASRNLTSGRVLFRVLQTYQPGGASERAMTLSELTIEKAVQDPREAVDRLRRWKRHQQRAEELQVALPDGTLLVKSLSTLVSAVLATAPQANFRVNSYRMQSRVDMNPNKATLQEFYTLLLAEMETLVLAPESAQNTQAMNSMVKTMAPTTTPTPGGKGAVNNKGGKGGGVSSPGKGSEVQRTPNPKENGQERRPCKFFAMETGCRYGKSCRAHHDVASLADAKERCWLCGSKQHRKNDCPTKSLDTPKRESPGGDSGGGSYGGGGEKAAGKGNKGGKGGGKLQKVMPEVPPLPGRQGETAETAASTGGSTGGGAKGTATTSTTSSTATSNAEVAQLLKSLSIQGPTLKAMMAQIGDASGMTLIDSGATHSLRGAVDMEEWELGLETTVALAEGTTSELRVKPGTKTLLAKPGTDWARIVPMHALSAVGYDISWTAGRCEIHRKGEPIRVHHQEGCPMVEAEDGTRMLQELEQASLKRMWRLVALRALSEGVELPKEHRTVELALVAMVRKMFPNLPEELVHRVVPYDVGKPENDGSLPWNRRKRRQIQKVKNVVIHLYSGPNAKWWERALTTSNTAVLCVDMELDRRQDMLAQEIYGYLLRLAGSGKVRCIVGGPPCRSVSALRHAPGPGPKPIRSEEWPWGLPTNSQANQQLVEDDSVLWLRMLLLYAVAVEAQEEECRTAGVEVRTRMQTKEDGKEPLVDFVMEQPEDPSHYREEGDWMSMWRTEEWRRFMDEFKLDMYNMDQGPMGHARRKPTTIASTLERLRELDGWRGPGQGGHEEWSLERPLHERCDISKTWAAWAEGLKRAIVVTLRQRKWYAEARLSRMSAATLEEWRQHVLNDHFPARRDCKTCILNSRSKAHMRVTHPAAWTLSLDLTGKLKPGDDQGGKMRYGLVGTYTFPVTKQGQALVKPWEFKEQVGPVEVDQPLPGLGELQEEVDQQGPERQNEGQEEVDHPLPGVHEVIEEDVPIPVGEVDLQEEDGEGCTNPKAKDGILSTWERLVQEETSVAIQTLTFVETVQTRAVGDLLPGLNRLWAQVKSLGLPVLRMHSDRACEFTSKAVRRWAEDRGCVVTYTSGDSWKSNGRCEAEVGVLKKATKVAIRASGLDSNLWPLIMRHMGQRRLREQMRLMGVPKPMLLPVGSTVYALKKIWHEIYQDWREVREQVRVLGPDKYSSMSSPSYVVQSVENGNWFTTGDVVTGGEDPPALADVVPDVELAVRPEPVAPAIPPRRLRQKTSPPLVSMMIMEGGEDGGGEGKSSFLSKFGFGFGEEWQDRQHQELDSNRQRPSQQPQTSLEERLHCLADRGPAQTHLRRTQAEERETYDHQQLRCVADRRQAQTHLRRIQAEGQITYDHQQHGRSDQEEHRQRQIEKGAWRRIHAEVTDYIDTELKVLNVAEVATDLPMVAAMVALRHQAEEGLLQLQREQVQEEEEWHTTQTISNQEVFRDWEQWKEPIRAEFQSLVTEKQALEVATWATVLKEASSRGVEVERLPSKMVFTRKAPFGKRKARACICGNYSTMKDSEEVYAGGADGCMVRAMIRAAALSGWAIGGTDVKTAFLNAPIRELEKMVVMEAPSVFSKLELMDRNAVLVVRKAMYGLVTSPRDWCVYRDTVLPGIQWRRKEQGDLLHGWFEQTKEENMWRLMEAIPGEQPQQKGLMSIYVDDVLYAAEPLVLKAAAKAVDECWKCSPLEVATTTGAVRFCGMEIFQGQEGGYHVVQEAYTKDLLDKYEVTWNQATDVPNYKIPELEEMESKGDVKATEIQASQAMTGALLWLSTRTRPDLAHGVAAMSRLTTRSTRTISTDWKGIATVTLQEECWGCTTDQMWAQNGVYGNSWQWRGPRIWWRSTQTSLMPMRRDTEAHKVS